MSFGINSCNNFRNYVLPRNEYQKNEVVTTEKKQEVSTVSSPQDNAVEYYRTLNEKFNDLKITAGNFSSNSSKGFGNVSISPVYLKKAANDPEIAAELEKNLNDIPEAVNWLKNMCRMGGSELKACGVVIDANGDMSSWSFTTRSTGNDDKKSPADEEKNGLTELIDEFLKRKDEETQLLEKDGVKKTSAKNTGLKTYKQYQSDLAQNADINFINSKV